MPITQDRMLTLLTEAKALRDFGEALIDDAAKALKLYHKGDFTQEDLPSILHTIASARPPKCDQLVAELAHFAKTAAANDKRRSRRYHERRAAGIPEGVYGPPPTSHLTIVPAQTLPTFNPTPAPEGTWSLDAIAKAIAVVEVSEGPTVPQLVRGATPPPISEVIYEPGTILPDEPPPDLSKGIFGG